MGLYGCWRTSQLETVFLLLRTITNLDTNDHGSKSVSERLLLLKLSSKWSTGGLFIEMNDVGCSSVSFRWNYITTSYLLTVWSMLPRSGKLRGDQRELPCLVLRDWENIQNSCGFTELWKNTYCQLNLEVTFDKQK